MGPDLAAMIPVNRETAKMMKWNMPFDCFRRLARKRAGGSSTSS